MDIIGVEGIMEYVQQNADTIQKIAQGVIYNNGFTYLVNVEIRRV